jgi:hypothetical protein
MRSIAVASSWLILSQLQLQGTYALQSSAPMPTDCNGTGKLFFHFGLGAHGGESLEAYFHDNGFATMFYLQGRLPKIIRADLLNGNDGLPQLQQKVAHARKENACGNVFVGDIKPNKVITKTEVGRAKAGYEELFRQLDKAFPDAVWIWLMRHPNKWATSLTFWESFKDEHEAANFLELARETHTHFHCSAFHHFGNRTLGNPTGTAQGNGKADVVQLTLEQLDWPLFVKQLQDASGYKGLEHDGEHMPQVGHHAPTWEYPAPDASKFNSWDYLTTTCGDSFRSHTFSLTSDAPWDDEVDSGL